MKSLEKAAYSDIPTVRENGDDQIIDLPIKPFEVAEIDIMEVKYVQHHLPTECSDIIIFLLLGELLQFLFLAVFKQILF